MVNKHNQRGATAIMMTVFFIMMITLIVIGFSTIVRREQIATLENTLSTQAQLAAESGINSAKAFFDKVNATGGTLTSKSDCNDPTPPGLWNSVKPEFPASTSDVKLTCLTWDVTPPSYEFPLQSYKTKSFLLPNSPSEDSEWGHSFQLSWSSTEGANTVYTDPNPLGATELPDLSLNNASIIKLTTATMSEVTNYNAIQIAYLVPYNGAVVRPTAGFVDLGNAAVGTNPTEPYKGMVYYVPCAGGSCTVNVAGLRWPDYPGANNMGPQGMYFENIGATTSNLIFTPSPRNVAVDKPLKGVVAKVDSNAMVQDISKRVVAYVDMQPQIWQPNFGAYADTLCKNYYVDNINNSVPVTGTGNVACP